MSYTISVRGNSKAAVLALVAIEFAKVVERDPNHRRDIDKAHRATKDFVAAVPDDPEKDVVISISGNMSGTWEGPTLVTVFGVGFTISAGNVPRPTVPTVDHHPV